MISKLCRTKFRTISLCILLCIIVTVVLSLHLLNKTDSGDIQAEASPERRNLPFEIQHPRNLIPALVHNRNGHHQKLNDKIKIINSTINNFNTNKPKPTGKSEIIEKVENEFYLKIKIQLPIDGGHPPNYNVHAFYYPWYGTPEHDGKFYHWNHPFIQHWNKKEAVKWPRGQHVPPDDVGANYYPMLGPYSSSDKEIIDVHMHMMRYARIGVVVVSWYPPGDADTEGKQPDSLLPDILEAALKYQLKVALHVEPYKDRNQHTLRTNFEYILKTYGSHPAFYRTDFRGKTQLPLIYIYDSYMVSSKDWAEIFTVKGSSTVRNTDLDGIFIGLVVEQKHLKELENAGFDGFFTYFATNGFTYGSSYQNWASIAQFAKTNSMMFIPSVGPGYIDTEVRAWNAQNTRRRLDGKYYAESVSNAFKVSPPMISITSFNEWHEGTQIESAVKKEVKGRQYLDYSNKGPHVYLNMTRQWVSRFST